jgi:hypothetical protein
VIQQADLAGKRIELLREVFRNVRRLAILANIGNAGFQVEMSEAGIAAGRLGLEVVTAPIRRADDIAPAFEAIEGRADALYVCGDALQATHRKRDHPLPGMNSDPIWGPEVLGAPPALPLLASLRADIALPWNGR